MRALVLTLAALFLLPAAAQANVFVLSQADPDPDTGGGITGLVNLADGGGETLRNGVGGSAITGTGGGPIVYGSGVIRQLVGNSYRTIRSGVGSNIRSMTVTGRGLVVANGNKLQYASSSGLSDVAHGTLPAAEGPWISITTQPNGLLLGWAFNGGEGKLYELNLASGAVDTRTFLHATSPTLNNCVPLENPCTKPPVPGAGSISADGQGGIWIAGAGTATGTIPDSNSAQLYYAANSGGTFNSIDSGFTRPHVSTTGTGGAYVSHTDNADTPYFSEVYRFTAPNNASSTAIATGDLADSFISGLAVDRCYASGCVISPPNFPNNPGGGANNPGTGGAGNNNTGASKSPLTLPKAKSVKLGKKGLGVKLTCATNCTVTVTGSLTFGKAKKASAAANKVSKTKVSLKAGRAKTVSVKLGKKMRKKVKKALRKKQKVTAKLKLSVKPATGKAFTRNLKLRVK